MHEPPLPLHRKHKNQINHPTSTIIVIELRTYSDLVSDCSPAMGKSHGLDGHRLVGQTGAAMSAWKPAFPCRMALIYLSFQVFLLPQCQAGNGFL